MCALVTGVQTCALPISLSPFPAARSTAKAQYGIGGVERRFCKRACLRSALVQYRVERRDIVPERDIAGVDRRQPFDEQLAERRLERPEALARMVGEHRSEEHTSELQSLMRNSYAVFCLKKKQKKYKNYKNRNKHTH